MVALHWQLLIPQMLSSNHAFPQWNLRDFFSLLSVLQLLTWQVCGEALHPPFLVTGVHHGSCCQSPLHQLMSQDEAQESPLLLTQMDLCPSQLQWLNLPKNPWLWDRGSRAGWALMLWQSPQTDFRRNLRWGQDLAACSKDLSAAGIHPITISKINESVFTPSSQTGEGCPQLY